MSDDHAAFAGSDLLIGIKREHAGVPERPHLAALVFSADRFAGILDDQQAVLPGDAENRREVGRASKSVHHNDGARAGSDRRLDFFGIKVQGFRIDIHKNRGGPFVADGVRHRNKSKRRHDDFVAFGDAQGTDAQVQPAGAGVDGDSVRGPRVCRHGMLKFLELWSEAQSWGTQHVRNRLDFALGYVRG